MIDLYGMTSPSVQKVRIMLEEVELPYNFVFLNVHKGDLRKPEFVALNPNGKVPVIVDHDGLGGKKPYKVFESGAILIYLAEKTGKLLPKDSARRFNVIQWLIMYSSGMGPMYGQFVHFNHFTTEHIYSAKRYETEVGRISDVLEKRLSESAFIADDEFTIADLSAFPWVRVLSREFGETHPLLKIGHPKRPNIARWFEAVSARPRVARALRLIDEMKKTTQTATPDELDRYFGRGAYSRQLSG